MVVFSPKLLDFGDQINALQSVQPKGSEHIESSGLKSLSRATQNKSPLRGQQVALSLTDLVLDAAM